ncbi:hypothetical protein OG453_03630 [Streptomyces sp. NBC_01381]|uniref:hypothetical protein n=1 Tax=Streptomyces sp. NBC_01381 TaxID=2903845 RepID=UPI002252E039|nr:hypothetical protein [Streptomyces sp. NBC_01381]MCX4665773.1 hypothetical protein [Streptomyces sp. NBC_01381]
MSFKAGTRDKDIRGKLKDPEVSYWDEAFHEPLHALVIVADDSPAVVSSKADEIRETVERGLGRCGKVVHQEIGKVLRLRPDGPVREHFGFADGISEPLFLTKDIKEAQKRDGTTRWNPAAPLRLVLAKDPVVPKDAEPYADGATGFGSYVVYRKLQQNVPHFNEQRLSLTRELAKTACRSPNPRPRTESTTPSPTTSTTCMTRRARSARSRRTPARPTPVATSSGTTEWIRRWSDSAGSCDAPSATRS